MKKIIALIVAVLFVFAVASASIAAEEKKIAPAPVEKKTQPAKKAATKIMTVTGEIKAVDAATKTITVVKKVKGQDKETVITVSDKDFAAVKAGDKITAKYTSADGKNTATSIKKDTEAKKAEPVKKDAAPAEKKAAPAKKTPGY